MLRLDINKEKFLVPKLTVRHAMANRLNEFQHDLKGNHHNRGVQLSKYMQINANVDVQNEHILQNRLKDCENAN